MADSWQSFEIQAILHTAREGLKGLGEETIIAIGKVQEKNLAEERGIEEKVSSLREEVEALEKRRKETLVPLEQKEKELQNRHVALLRKEESVAAREAQAVRNLALLGIRLDDVDTQLTTIEARKANIGKAEERLKTREDALKRRAEGLDKTSAENEASSRKVTESQRIKEYELEGKLTILRESEKRIKAKETALEARELLLKDRYQSLDLAIKEAKQKHPTLKVK